jgi:hypothetical protein
MANECVVRRPQHPRAPLVQRPPGLRRLLDAAQGVTPLLQGAVDGEPDGLRRGVVGAQLGVGIGE